MGTEPKLRLLSIPPISITLEDLSGTVTPPFNASAAVPFRWEEEPGKPRACTDLITTTATLELPPRMFLKESPTTVLEGPYVKKRPKASSFRMTHKESSSIQGSLTPESMFLVSKRWFWSSKRRKLGKIISQDCEISPCHSLYFDCEEDQTQEEDQWANNTGKSPFWASIYGGLKHAISWKPKILKELN